ncbi:MAG: pantoate--beta-alanine ligase [Alphaproteobacteria bacterium]|nr:pantoate--beta-alanine ligase [Alphaproteobacteria bacterium]MDP6516508.1 pantoate--beta-alanine ligase [Alphaproteobacteria bacterium]
MAASPQIGETEVAETVSALRLRVDGWRQAGHSVALVPTMGFLHRAHMTLIEVARRHCQRVVVSIFVNPKQFGEGEDFALYPRDEADDLAQLRAAGVELAFMPSVGEMYPPGFAATVSISGLTDGLCGASRPGHFDGVSTVVTKLFLQCRPDIAVFGEKDYQQLQTVRRMTRDLDIPVEIVAVPTVREPDGLAISSRNVYLDADQRRRATTIYRVLGDIGARLTEGASVADETARGLAMLREGTAGEVEYLELRDAASLEPIARLVDPARLLTAVQMGATRLIDNRPVDPPAGATPRS